MHIPTRLMNNWCYLGSNLWGEDGFFAEADEVSEGWCTDGVGMGADPAIEGS